MEFTKSDRLIDGVEIKELKKITTYDFQKKENGFLIDILRGDDEIKKDGPKLDQIYMTTAFPGKVKGFHWTKKKTYLFCVVIGKAKLVIIDDREDSKTIGMVNEIIIGEDNYKVVRIPPLVKRGFKNIGENMLVMLNIVTPGFDPKDPDILDWKYDYKW